MAEMVKNDGKERKPGEGHHGGEKHHKHHEKGHTGHEHKMKHEQGHHGGHHGHECCSGKHKHGHEHGHEHEEKQGHEEREKNYGLMLLGLAIGSAAGIILTLMMTTRMGRDARRMIVGSGSQILHKGEQIASPEHAARLVKEVKGWVA
jgi:ABC-type nickel/cobalt efflux system permease component RcnA